ncbi:MAG: phenylacetate--CoA ligase family protein [Chitinophagaceae bacterium]|nr:phenylacetate--CoA ligase family protein [Chitinophagaceae bacterium]
MNNSTIDQAPAATYAKLFQALEYAALHSPYYKKTWASIGFDLSSFKSIEDLKSLPLTSKDDLQKHNDDFLSIDPSLIIDYSSTSGTLGKPVSFPLSQKDLDRLALNEYLSLKATGVEAGTKILLTTTMDKQFMAGLAYFLGAQKLGASVIRSGPGLPAMKWDAIQSLKPEYMIAVPSFVLKMIDYAKEQGIDYQHSSIKKILCIGEPIRNPDFTNNVLSQRILEQWDVKLYSTYASTEKGTAFTECEEGKGGHVLEDLIYVELLDEQGNEVPAGQEGEVVITTFGVEAMPLIRYKTGDIAILYHDACACGKQSPRLGPILGRKQQMIKFKGTTIFPQAVFEVLNKLDFIVDYYLKVSTDEMMLDTLTVFVCTKKDKEVAKKQLVELFKASLRVTPDIVFQTMEELGKVKYKSENRKPILFLDNRTK